MAKQSDSSNVGCFATVAVLIVLGLVIRFWPIIVGALVIALVIWAITAGTKSAKATRARRREEEASAAKQQRIDTLGPRAIARIDGAVAAAEQVARSEAAQAGWLGDVDFAADLAGITDSFAQAYALRGTAARLAALPRPNDDDRRLLADAQRAAETLEAGANRRVDLITKCAAEADLVDQSLRQDREDALNDAERARLHSELHGLVYGVEASMPSPTGDSAADRVIARVAGYHEVKAQVDAAREQGFG